MELGSARLAVLGLGFVSLPLAVAFGRLGPTVGFDINRDWIEAMRRGDDPTLEVDAHELAEAEGLKLFADPVDLADCNVYVITVPTPIDAHKRPDLTALIKASEAVRRALRRGDVVIYKSTAYPGAAKEDCVPVLERVLGLKFNVDFFPGCSPERANPGDREHRLATIMKVTARSTPEAADSGDAIYRRVGAAGTHEGCFTRMAEVARPELRNVRMADFFGDLTGYGAKAHVDDPGITAQDAEHDNGIKLVAAPEAGIYDAIIIAAAHNQFRGLSPKGVRTFARLQQVNYYIERAARICRHETLAQRCYSLHPSSIKYGRNAHAS